MREARGLLPYAAFAAFLVGATVVALVVSNLGTPVGSSDSLPVPSATASAAPRSGTDLSPSGRLAYWRTEPSGDHLLFLANADNSRRRSVARVGQPGLATRTKWAIDGSAVAYVENGVHLVVVTVDGRRTTYSLPQDLRQDRYRIVDHRFSASGVRIAATVQRQSGPETDVYVAVPGGTWQRLTTTEDVLAADWLSDDELLVQTTGGIVGRLRAAGHDVLLPLTSLTGATPLLGHDGRVYFLSGRVSAFTGSTETFVSASNASVWSMSANGEDLRRESATLGSDGFRLDGFWPGGGYLVHRGTNPAQVVIGKEGQIDLPNTGGLIERLQVSSERRLGLGFAGMNLIHVTIAAAGGVADAVVLLGSVAQGDAWFPRTARPAEIAPVRPDVPPARYVFALGGHLWSMGPDGIPSILRAGNTNAQTLRRFALPAPRWSPAGDRVLTLESLASGATSQQLIAVAIARDGTVQRYTNPSSIAAGASWSPDGRQIAVIALPEGAGGQTILASELAVTIVDATSGSIARTLPGREAAWTSAGIIVLSNGTFRPGDLARDGQTIDLWDGTERRTVTTAQRIVDGVMAALSSTARGNTQATGLTAAPDGRHASIRVNLLGRNPAVNTFVAFRATDGAVTVAVSGDVVLDDAWSPAGRHIGFTRQIGQGAAAPRRATVRDAETGDTLLDAEGRFAGWSPDGAWVYVARNEGLFAQPLAGGELRRLSPYGVIVAVTRP